MLAAPAPERHIVAGRAHPVEQAFQRILRMGFMPGGRPAGQRIGVEGTDGVPRIPVHLLIQTGKDDSPSGHQRDPAPQSARSEERSVGKEWGSTWRVRWSPSPKKKKK